VVVQAVQVALVVQVPDVVLVLEMMLDVVPLADDAEQQAFAVLDLTSLHDFSVV